MMNQKKNKNKKKTINHAKKSIFYILKLENKFIIFIFLLLILKIKEVNLRYLQIYDSEISLLINKTKSLTIFNSIYNGYVDKIIVNGIIQNYTDNNAKYLTKEQNNITIRWNNQLTSCSEMFKNLNNIIKADLTKFDSSNIINMYHMFYGCGSLISINLNNINTKKVKTMNGMFDLCISLTSLNLSYFDTSSVEDISGMFYNCTSLITLDLKNFDTSKVTKMTYVFNGCISLLSLNVENFDTSTCTSFYYMFNICQSLISLNLSNFDKTLVASISETTNMLNLYHKKLKYCIKDNTNYIFSTLLNDFTKDCGNICFTDKNHKLIKEKYICIDNCKNDDTYRYEFNSVCYEKCPKGTHISNLDDFICESDLICDYYYDYNHSSCLYEIPDGFYLNDSTLKTIDKCDIRCKKCNLESTLKDLCISCNIENYYYPKINDDKNEDLFIGCYYREIEGFYLDNDNSILKPCYSNCKKCTEYGNIFDNKCTECYSNYTLNNTNCYQICEYYYYFDSSNLYHCTYNNSCPNEYNKLIRDKNQCIDQCQNDDKYIYEYQNICLENEIVFSTSIITEIKNKNTEYILIDNTDNNKDKKDSNNFTDNFVNDYTDNNKENIDNSLIYNTDNSESSNSNINSDTDKNKRSNIQELQTEESKSDDLSFGGTNNEFIYKYSILELFNNKSIIKDKNEKEKDDIINKLKEALLSKEMDELISNRIKMNNQDLIIYFDDAIYQFTSTYNQNNNIYSNLSIILLKECESKLKGHYNISQNEPLLIFKVDKLGEGFLISIVEYEVYNIKTKQKLDLSLCKNININIIYPVDIDKNQLFKYNSSSGYYNDICFTYTTENNTDICVKDRQKEYEKKKMYICEANCDFEDYDSENKKIECKCQIKIKFPLFSEIIINKDKFLKNFFDIESIINLNLIKCYKVLFTRDGLITNAGSYILLSIIFFLFISLILFIIKGYKIFFSLIDDIILKMEFRKKKKKIKNKKISKINNNYKKNNKENPPKIKNKINKKRKVRNKNKIINKKINILKTNSENIANISSSSKIEINKNNKKSFNNKNYQNIHNSFINIDKNKNNENISKINYIKYFNDYELNSLSYNEALEIDKRTYIEYYFSLIRIKHLLIFSFYTNSDYNSKIIKISLFLFIFSLNFTVNALFFNDSTMHKIYEEYGNFNFIYQIPQILYSTIICSFINLIASFLSSTEKNVIELKKLKKNDNLREKVEKMKKFLIIKFILFYVFVFILVIFFWYYLSCFCAVYKNTQIHLIKDTLISFSTTLMYPFILYLLPGIFRIPALKSKKGDKLFLYKFSKFIQLF